MAFAARVPPLDGKTVVVSGWLMNTPGTFGCPAQPASVSPDTAFQTCPFAWLAMDEAQPVAINPGQRSSITPPPTAIRAQPAGYDPRRVAGLRALE